MSENRTNLGLAERRLDVNRLFEASQARDQREKAQKAYDAAQGYDLHEPWKAFCAYRLAHLLMSTATDTESIAEAERLFLEATVAECLAPFPAIYRLAALQRLHPKDRDKFREAFEKALEVVHRRPVPEHLEYGREAKPHFLNMLRLAGYYFDTSPEVEDGSMEEKTPWVLVGNDPKLTRIRRSKQFIFQEIDALNEIYRDAVFFKLSWKDQYVPDVLERHWKLGKSQWQPAPHYPTLRLLSLLLKGGQTSVEGLQARLDATPNTFAKIKSRLKEGLGGLIQPRKDHIYVSDRGKFPRMNPDIRIFGAVEAQAL